MERAAPVPRGAFGADREVDVKPLYAHDAIAGGLFWATLVAWLVFELHTGVRGWLRSRDADEANGGETAITRADRGSMVFLSVACGVGMIGCFVVSALSGGTRWAVPGWVPLTVGLVIAWAGMLFRGWAVRSLGDAFTFTVQVRSDQRVVRSGPYRVLRHPSYTGGLVTLAGIGIALDTLPGLILLLVCVLAGYRRRINVEEQELRRHLGEEYDSFSRDTYRLVPYLW